MNRQMNRSRSRRSGSLLGGLILIEIGLLQFFQAYFDIEWSEMWPLLLIVPGLALVLGALSSNSVSRHGRSNNG